MGEIAKTVHEGGGKVTGVTPGFIKSKSCTARIIVNIDWYTICLQQLLDDGHGDTSFISSMLLPWESSIFTLSFAICPALNGLLFNRY